MDAKDLLRFHVTGAIERGEKEPIVEHPHYPPLHKLADLERGEVGSRPLPNTLRGEG